MKSRGPRPACPTRREFIEATGCTLLMAATGSALARPLGSNESVGLGLIGCGGRGRSLEENFLKVEGARFRAFADPDPAQIEKARRTQGEAGPRAEAVSDFRRLLERKEVEAVVVATPDHWHTLPAILACQAGKDVYVEKPLSRTVLEGRTLVEAARRSGRTVMIGTQQRSGAHFQSAVERVRSGAIGQVSRARVWNVWNLGPKGIGNPPDGDPPPGVDYDLWLGPAPRRRFNPNRFHWNYVYFWDYAGGILTGWGIHHVDIVHWALGVDAPLAVAASGGQHSKLPDNRETPDTIEVLYDYPGFTLQASIYEASDHPIEGRTNGLAFYGTKGALVLDRDGWEIIPRKGQAGAEKQPGSAIDGVHQAHFIECLREKKPPNSPVEQGHRSTIPLLLGNIAFRTERKLHWDAHSERFKGDAEADHWLGCEYRAPWKLESGA
jgi:predicted dehydrogenase